MNPVLYLVLSRMMKMHHFSSFQLCLQMHGIFPSVIGRSMVSIIKGRMVNVNVVTVDREALVRMAYRMDQDRRENARGAQLTRRNEKTNAQEDAATILAVNTRL